jgi:hypothetical protein
MFACASSRALQKLEIGQASRLCLTKRLEGDDPPKRGKITQSISGNAIAFFVVNPGISAWLRGQKLP